ncbi:MAG: divalent-cation tolerance protein CutA [Candidatus Omnitrophica bacterium]|nr:divalent-cation tolerance protein CutA [Candidatus Omnitrophota bacterium]
MSFRRRPSGGRGALLILTTAPTAALGRSLAARLVKRKLAACVSLKEGWVSYYEWNGGLEKAKEVLLLIKTDRDHYQTVEKFLLRHHPYKVPEIIALPVLKGSKAYLSWISEVLE